MTTHTLPVLGWLLSSAAITFPLQLHASSQQLLPWQKRYTGSDAHGDHVIALWEFEPGAEGRDSSGHGHDLSLRGRSRFVPSGRFGSCLESFPADRHNDKPQGAFAKNDPRLTPKGPFTLELWFKAKPEMDQYPTVFLLDKKYYHYPKDLPQANHDYCLYMKRTGPNQRRFVAYLGYGRDSAAYTSEPVTVEPGKWLHVAFAYDGSGTGRFFFNGKSIGRVVHKGRGPVWPGPYNLVIGDRYGSIHAGFPGYIDQVRIVNRAIAFFSGTLQIDLSTARTAFLRMENDAVVPVRIVNDTGVPLGSGAVTVRLAGHSRRMALPELRPGAEHMLTVPVDTTLRPDTYRLTVTASAPAAAADANANPYRADQSLQVTIAARPLPHQMPVVMWGSGDLDVLEQIGFTHQLVYLVDYQRVWTAGQPTEAADSGRLSESRRLLDDYLRRRLGAVVYLYPGHWVMTRPELKAKFQRVDRSGKPTGRDNACAGFPELRQFAYNVGASVARSFGDHPALQAALIHSEVRDGTNLCFHDHDRRAFRQAAGFDIPPQAAQKWGLHYSRIPGFPANRVIPDDDRLLAFYRWFWKVGDGWNGLHSQVVRGLKSTGRHDLWTFFDPAVRVPSIWGSGGDVDVLSQWTYSYPDPIKIGQATDELFAMAAGSNGRQRVMKMTQIIWYRSQTAPKLPADPSQRAAWERQIPDARFITIAPDHLREAFWCKLSRPIAGIMYHGWGSLVPSSGGSYRFTNPQTRQVLTELIAKVVRPLGPTLLQVPDRPADVAILESFASQVFAGRGTWGWSNRWEADLHLILQWAHLQPQILYDETVVRDGLDRFRVLALPHCDVLTESVAQRVAAFQRQGGILIGDEQLTPALRPDIRLTRYRRTGQADKDKAALQAQAAELRRQLDRRYQRYADASDPDVVIRLRRYHGTDYLFAVNDKRTFGDYVGHHRKVMEKGLPNEATVSVRRHGGQVYDLVAHRPVPAKQANGRLQFGVRLGPGHGRVFMITDRPLDQLQVTAPASARLGDQVAVQIAVLDGRGQPADAVVPVKVDIRDPDGQRAEFSGYYGAGDGRLSICLDLAGNDRTGQWTIEAAELASGRTARHRFTLRR